MRLNGIELAELEKQDVTRLADWALRNYNERLIDTEIDALTAKMPERAELAGRLRLRIMQEMDERDANKPEPPRQSPWKRSQLTQMMAMAAMLSVPPRR